MIMIAEINKAQYNTILFAITKNCFRVDGKNISICTWIIMFVTTFDIIY